MKVAIPAVEKNGVLSKASGHFGSAQWFAVMSTEDESIEWIDNENAEHTHGQCQPTEKLNDFGVNAVVCQGMGVRAIQKLNTMGLRVFVAKSGTTVKDIFEQFKDNKLKELTPEEGCQHEHGSHQHG
jgi:predicted Fe-Mo cluster-binding NifX family protein